LAKSRGDLIDAAGDVAGGIETRLGGALVRIGFDGAIVVTARAKRLGEL
jgi:hypothetical protein